VRSNIANYSWHEIADIPDVPGVYAWYYTPEITTFDLNEVISQIQEMKAAGEVARAKDKIIAFLDRTVFSYFREQPYVATLRGPLKPQYEGHIEHTPKISTTLLDRIVDDPSRLATMREVLEASSPKLASPIYIGMSERLGRRLRRHKSLIEKYGELSTTAIPEDDQRDQSFAREIRARSIPPPRLFVMTTEISGPPGTYVDIENILNRIHYPLLGRN